VGLTSESRVQVVIIRVAARPVLDDRAGQRGLLSGERARQLSGSNLCFFIAVHTSCDSRTASASVKAPRESRLRRSASSSISECVSPLCASVDNRTIAALSECSPRVKVAAYFSCFNHPTPGI
jgi:hypothetical protein